MSDDEKRRNFLKKYYCKKIMSMFSEGVEVENEMYKKAISYEEAISVLEHTISEIGKKPILF